MKKTKKHKEIPSLDPKFFWEFIFDKINWERSYKMVIARISVEARMKLMKSCVFMVVKK